MYPYYKINFERAHSLLDQERTELTNLQVVVIYLTNANHYAHGIV